VRPAVVLILAALLAGCGGGGGGAAAARKDYVKALNRAQSGLTQRFGALQQRVTPTSTPEQDQRTLDAYGRVVDDTVRDLRAVRPPAGFEALHRRFIAQVASYGTALQEARRRLRSDRPQTVLEAQSVLRGAVQRTGEQLNATIKAINDRLKD